MSGPETTFIGAVHKHLPPGLYRIKNNNTFNAGQADVWYSGPKRDLWVEYKFVKVPVRGETLIDLLTGKKPDLSPLQQEWLRRRHAEGRNVGLLVGSKDGGVWFPGVSWDRPYNAAFFRAALKTRKDLAQIISTYTGAS